MKLKNVIETWFQYDYFEEQKLEKIVWILKLLIYLVNIDQNQKEKENIFANWGIYRQIDHGSKSYKIYTIFLFRIFYMGFLQIKWNSGL